MKKILISIFLAAAMILTNISVMAEKSENEKYKEAIEFLSMLNIISVQEENDDFSAQTDVTREEFCIYLSRAFKVKGSYETNVFSDLSQDSGLSQYIQALYEKGVVSGYGGAFRPKDFITYNEAIKMLVSILNYDYAASVGGYPDGYLRTASDLRITDKVHGANRITKGVAAQLIYNALNAPLMEVAGITMGDISFKSNSDKSVLMELYDIYEGKGVVMANEVSAFTAPVRVLKSGEVQIDNTVYKIGNSNADKLLGHYIKFYYLVSDDDEEYEIVKIIEDKSEEIVINSSHIIDYEVATRTYKYEDENGKIKNITLDDDFLVMYNHDYPISNFTKEMMNPDLGRVKLISGGNGKNYSAVMIEEYENHIVSATDEKSETIYFSDGKNENNRRRELKIYDSNGQEIEISAINKWDVASVLCSSDRRKATVFISKNSIEGKVTKKGDASDPRVEIDGESYYVDTTVLSNIRVGKSAVFYFDYCGIIAGIKDIDSSDLRYAYVTEEAKMDEDYGENSEERAYVRLFDQDGTEKKLHMAKRVLINDASEKNQEVIKNTWNSIVTSDKKIVKYKLNSDGEINALYTYTDGREYIRQLFSGTAYWNLKQRSFGGKVTMANDAIVFIIPGTDVKDYKISGVNMFVNDKEASVTVYTMGDNVYGEVIVRNLSNTSYERPIGIVTKVIDTLDEDEEISKKVTIMYNGSKEEFMLTKNEILGNVSVGDVVKISLDHNNKIQNFLMVYDDKNFIDTYTENGEEKDNVSDGILEPQGDDVGYRSQHRCYWGYAYDLTGGLLRYSNQELPNLYSDGFSPVTENALLSEFRIYVVDGKGISLGTEKDIKDYRSVKDKNECSRIIVHTMWGDPEDIIVIR